MQTFVPFWVHNQLVTNKQGTWTRLLLFLSIFFGWWRVYPFSNTPPSQNNHPQLKNDVVLENTLFNDLIDNFTLNKIMDDMAGVPCLQHRGLDIWKRKLMVILLCCYKILLPKYLLLLCEKTIISLPHL